MITLPINITTGELALHIVAKDGLGMEVEVTQENVSTVLDAPSSWFGPHMSNADSQWLGVTQLPSTSPSGIYRGVIENITGCVLDVDHDTTLEQPEFLVSRGQLGEVVYIDMSDSNHHCYQSTFFVENGTSIEDIDIEMRKNDGSLVSQRSIRILDNAPQISLSFENSSSASIDRIIDNGDEFLRIVVTDADDFSNTYLGDVTIDWPGYGVQVLSVEGVVNLGNVQIEIVPPIELLEAGNVDVYFTLQDSRGVESSSSISIPLVLNAPRIVSMIPCNELGSIDELMFGHPAILGAVIESDRPLENIQLSLRQLGWSVNAPQIQEPTWVQSTDECLQYTGDDVYWFRLQLDGSFASAEGSIQLIASTIDGYPTSMQIPMLFRHAPPIINGTVPSTIEAGSDLKIELSITDLDGLGDVSCSVNLTDDSNTSVWLKEFRPIESQDSDGMNQLRWPVPRNQNESTDFLNVTVSCDDSDGESGAWASPNKIEIEPYVCRINCNTSNDELVTTASSSNPMPWVILVTVFLAIILGTMMMLRRRNSEEKWASDESLDDFELLTSDSIAKAEASLEGMSAELPPIPDGWTEEAFVDWLQGEKPPEWSEEQWDAIRLEHAGRLNSPDDMTDEILF
jgi:hypothetical protein